MKKKKATGLGRSIGEIFSATAGSNSQSRELDVNQLEPGPWQPRQTMNPQSLAELTQTVAARGVLQPILVRQAKNGYQIIAGERRWRAAQQAGLQTIPVIIREFSDHDAMLAALVENIQREDLPVLDQATAARRIIDELGMSVTEAATALGISRPALSNLLRLLELDAAVRKLLANDAISAGHARTIAALPTHQQEKIARTVVTGSLTVRQVEQLVKRRKKSRSKKGKVDPDSTRLSDKLTTHLGMRVQISGSGTKGKVVIHYRSLDSLDALVKILKK